MSAQQHRIDAIGARPNALLGAQHRRAVEPNDCRVVIDALRLPPLPQNTLSPL
jgi:hypothetical protein